ncbi:uncharacterized protein LOC108030763 isoform X2 [Drosophila biarmipes]|uniref:uncharacterized protein LOC108030763 isoform X2 n=1 Tax=Drosophila biarmipes TaxID=125945 RepID=UPI0021CC6E24|nr:uncharacterized protein LOC108030763 isoform X2 [Drosophila biarmipes]
MDLERELPTDDASMELEGQSSSSDSLLTLKRSWSQETMRPSSEEEAVPFELSSDDIHLGLLRGLIEYDSLNQPSDEDEAGDYPKLLSRTADRGEIAEIVKEMRNEFMVKVSSKAKSFKEILIKKGMMESMEDSNVHHAHRSDVRDTAETDNASKVLEQDNAVRTTRSQEVNRNNEITQLISEINQFTSGMERDPDNADWPHFRANLLEIYKHYVSVGGQEEKEQPCTVHSRCPAQAAAVSEPLQDLRHRAKALGRNIRGLECKMLTLDQSFDGFCDKFNRSVITKERVERDMVGLAMMRDGIGRRLSQMEEEFRRAKELLFKRGRSPDGRANAMLPPTDTQLVEHGCD